MKPIVVTWRDAASGAAAGLAWATMEDAKEWNSIDCVCMTVGYLVAEDKRNLTLAQSVGPNVSRVGGLWCIPVGSVISRKRLR